VLPRCTQRELLASPRSRRFNAISSLVVWRSSSSISRSTIKGSDVALRFSLEDPTGARVVNVQKIYRAIADVPDDGAILTAAIAGAQNWLDRQAAVATKRNDLAALIGLSVNGGVL
jgi:hypothetical protein